MHDRIRHASLVVCGLSIAVLAGCASAPPTLTAAPNRRGPYVTLDDGQGAARAGLATPSSGTGWRPQLTAVADAACVDEIAGLEQGLALGYTACPAFERSEVAVSGDADQPASAPASAQPGASAPAINAPTTSVPVASAKGDADQPATTVPPIVPGDADQPAAALAATPGAAPNRSPKMIRCYDLGAAMLVAEYRQTGSLCKRIMGLALFHKR